MRPDTAGDNPYVFVVGCLRSGTTLLQRMLDAHSQLAVAYDSHFIPQPVKHLDVGVDPPLTPELIEDVVSHRRFARLGLPNEAIREAADRAPTYSAFVTALYDTYARLHGKPLAGEKSPGFCRHLPHLHALFPWVRTIHLVRDGRDVALSVVDWGKGPSKLEMSRDEPVAVAALWWSRDVMAGRESGEALGSKRYREVRYEQLVAQPEQTMRALSAFLQLTFEPRMAEYHEGKTRTGRSAKASWLPPTPGLRDWRTQMPERDVELFEALAGNELTAMGYERAFERISPEIGALADRCRERWNESVSSGKGKADRKARRAARTSTQDLTSTRNPYVFVVGSPRSGTTLLKRIIDAHPTLAMTPETHWIPRFFKQGIGVTSDGQVTDALVPELLSYKKFTNMRIDRADLEALVASDPMPTYAEFVSRLFDLYGQRRGKPLVGDKTPGYVKDVKLLHDLWPHARFVHLIRDGRDVCLSVLDWDRAPRNVGRFSTWDEDRVSTIALWWERLVRRGREAGAELGPGLYFEVGYEALVEDLAREGKALCAFLGLEYDDALVRFHEGKTRDDPGLSAKRAWLPPTAGIRDWRQDLAPGDVEKFEAIAGDLLDALGYERACPEPSDEARRHAAHMRETFCRRSDLEDAPKKEPRGRTPAPVRSGTVR